MPCRTVLATPPIAGFIADRTKGKAPLTVRFEDTSINNPTSWRWAFGDGGESTASNPTHTYQLKGDYTVTLNIANSSGADDEIKNDFIHVDAPGFGGKSFTFVCENEFARGPIFGLEKLTMNVGDTESCTLKLTNHEPGKTVEVSLLLKKGFRSAVKVEPARSVTDEKGEIEITITAVRKGRDWAAWAVKNERGQFSV
ncbi:MAG: PKD domain-containing protein [Candidatus Anammoxibacter sp.]